MKKAIKTQYGIEITKPWSKEMYDHNEMVADAVRTLVTQQWENALNRFEEANPEYEMADLEWYQANEEMEVIQKAVTIYSFGSGYTVDKVSRIVEQDLEDAPFYRLKEIAEDLGLPLKVGFVGFN